eukprot:GSChrysophyteH2.ASY1.ANO1.1197.1 assembled CDS
MLHTMYADDGIGLAAPQVGLQIRMMVFNEKGDPENTQAEMVLCNPRVHHASEERAVEEEACLSFPGVTMSVNTWKSSSSCGVRARGWAGAFVGGVDVGDVDGGSGADDAKCQELL